MTDDNTDRFKVLPLETRPVDIIFNKDDHLDIEDDEAVMADDVDSDEEARIYAESHRKGWVTPKNRVYPLQDITVEIPTSVSASQKEENMTPHEFTQAHHDEFASRENIITPLPEELESDFDATAYKQAIIQQNGEIRTTSRTGGQKGVKPERYDLIPVEAMDLVARLYGFGAEKYAEHNWRQGYDWSKSYASLQRHASTFWKGENLDPETGLPHLAGVVFHALTLMTFMNEQLEFDDRWATIAQPQEIEKDPRDDG